MTGDVVGVDAWGAALLCVDAAAGHVTVLVVAVGVVVTGTAGAGVTERAATTT